MNPLWVAVAVFVLLQLVDAILTVKILDMGGRETNPFLIKVFAKVGPRVGLIVFKLIVIVAVIVVAAIGQFSSPTGIGVLCALDLIYLFVVANNIKAYREQKRIWSMRGPML